MDAAETCLSKILRHPARFLLQVVAGFRSNQGLLLAGAVAYYTLLSIVPLVMLLVVALSHFVPEERLLEILATDLELIIPGQADKLVSHFTEFLAHRDVVGWIGLVVLLFFSSMAFTVLENAMSVIFLHRVNIHRRHFLVSAILPYAFILLVGIGLLLITLISGAIDAMESSAVRLFGIGWYESGVPVLVLYLMGWLGLVLLLTSIYLVMPVGRVSVQRALFGGVVAAALWELARHVLIWYFSTLSFVNVIYGSLATAIVALVSLEVAAIILLFGAQVIAEYERFGVDSPCTEKDGAMTT